MFNLLRMDMYQVFRGSLFWVTAAIVTALTFGTSAILWFVDTQFYRDLAFGTDAVVSAENSGHVYQITQIEAASNTLLNGGLLLLLVPLFMALFLTQESNSGFIKNVFTAGATRTSYYFSKVLSLFTVSFALTAIGILSSLVSSAIFGLNFVSSPPLEILAWGLCVAILIGVLSLLISLFAWLTRNKVASVLITVFVSTGLLVGLIGAALSSFPSLSSLTDFTIYASLISISSGLFAEQAFSLVHIAGVAGVSFVVYAVLSYLTVRIKDV